jgi:hypothetical protein
MYTQQKINIEVEVEALILVGKYVLYGIGSLIGMATFALIGWNFKRTNDTFTKQETKELIKDSLEAHSKQTERLISSVDKLTDNIQTLNTKIAVVETKIEGK